MKKSPVISSSVATRDGDIITPRPMATYIEPSQRAVIRDAQASHHGADSQHGWVSYRPPGSIWTYHRHPDAQTMSDIGIFFIGLTAGLLSSGLVFLALHLGGLL